MKALSNIQGPMRGKPLCFHEAAFIFIGHEHETAPWMGAGEEGSLALFRCLYLSMEGPQYTGGAPTQAFGFCKFSVISEKWRQFLADFCFCQFCTHASHAGHQHVVCTQYKMVILDLCMKEKLFISVPSHPRPVSISKDGQRPFPTQPGPAEIHVTPGSVSTCTPATREWFSWPAILHGATVFGLSTSPTPWGIWHPVLNLSWLLGSQLASLAPPSPSLPSMLELCLDPTALVVPWDGQLDSHQILPLPQGKDRASGPAVSLLLSLLSMLHQRPQKSASKHFLMVLQIWNCYQCWKVTIFRILKIWLSGILKN